MGYVGIPAAALLADVDGFEVIGIQRRSKRSGWKIEALNRGECPILNEPELPELIRRVVLEKKTFRVTDDTEVLRDMNYILIDVQTPTDKETHQPLYKSLREVSAVVGQKMKDGAVVIVESTVAPGTTENIVKPILEENSGKTCGKDFYLVFAYERVMVGRLINNIVNYPRVIGGVTEECTKKGLWLYKHIVKEKLIPVSATTAEVAKVVENTYRDVQIAFANEVALACEALHVDYNDVRKCVNSLPFNSNVNYAGRCDRELTNGAIGEWKTAYYLYDSNGNPMPYLQQWWGHNSIRGYAWAKGASKAILLGMGVYPQRKKGGFPYSGIEHLVISIEDWEIEEFKRDMTLISEQILEAYSKHNLEPGCFESNLNRMFQDKLYRHFPTNTSRCHYIRSTCQFKDLCTRDCPKGLYENYYIIDPFEPWKEEE